ncbi:CHAT domain-containing protein [Lentzea chajnantorensis]
MSASADPRATIAGTVVRGSKAERAQALHDLSVAHVELGHLDEAAALAQRGLRLTGEPRFRLTLAWIDLDRGRHTRSLRHLDLATPQLRGNELARARCLRGLHLCRSADPRPAMAELTAVIRELRRYDDQRWLANALIGRGIARCYALRLAGADADFTAAAAALRTIGESGRIAMCLHNRGFVAMLAGDLPSALRRYEEAARAGLDSTSRPEALVDRAEALLAAGLDEEAHRVVEPALALLERCGRRSPEAVLLGARCALRRGDTATALRLYRKAGRPDGELMLAAGEVDAVAAQRFRGPARTRALGWLAQARRSDRRGALAACRAGLRVLDEDGAGLANEWVRRELTGRALDLARTPREVLRWGERHRRSYPSPLPPGDPALASALAGLRRARALGGPVEALERDIRRLTVATARRSPSGDEVPGHLPVVSFVVHRGQVLAVTPESVRVVAEPAALVQAAKLALRAGRTVDNDLLPQVDEVVVVPDGVLRDMPWAALRPKVHVLPALDRWCPPRPGGRRVWVAGPDLGHEEVTALHREHGGTVLGSTVEETLRGLEGAGIAHIAAHGVVNADNPLFSYLELDDGPLYGYDLARVEHPPEVVVLSACESGLARAFLDAGTRAVLASVLPVPDRQVGAAMAAVHRRLDHPAAAARAVAHLGFSCYGTGTSVAACSAAANEVPVHSDCAEPTLAGTSVPLVTTSTHGP